MADSSISPVSTAGMWTRSRRRRRWVRDPRRRGATLPLPCKPEAWHLLRVPDELARAAAGVIAAFLDADGGQTRQVVALERLGGAADAGHWLGWVQAPAGATRWRLEAPRGDATTIAAHAIAERDTKCHPLANLARPETYRTPFPIERIVLPRSLANLATLLDGPQVRIIDAPRSLRDLAKQVMGCACVLDPAWVDDLNLTLRDIERIVPITWMVADLATIARLVRDAGAADARIATRRSPHGLMSARVEYADVPTRGFALMDVFPFGVHAPKRGFSLRVLEANRSWKKYAGECGFALVLSSQTPSEDHCTDVLTAMRAIGPGELIASDLPWLVAGQQGPLVAPELARHALRMHLGCNLAAETQYWNRWDDTRVVVRDIAELARRYPPLRPARWRSSAEGLVSLGISLSCTALPARNGAPRHYLIRTGRIDQHDAHEGAPPEPLMILMRQLARDWIEETEWAKRCLTNAIVSWQFDSAEGQRYGVLFETAGDVANVPVTATLALRASRAAREVGAVRRTGAAAGLDLPASVGIFGDRSLDYQVRLTEAVRGWIAGTH